MSRTTQVVIDLIVLTAAFWVALGLRFDWAPPYYAVKRALFLWAWVIAFQYFTLYAFDVPRCSWRYVSLREVRRIFYALTVSLASLTLARFVFGNLRVELGAAATYAYVPLGVVAIDFVLAFLGVVGVRVVRRAWGEHVETTHRTARPERSARVLLIGAGQAGFQVAKEIASRPDLGLIPVGFLDDDADKKGSLVHGLAVLGPIAKLSEFKAREEVDQVLITIANAPGEAIRRIARICDEAGLPPQIIPGIYEIVGGKVNLSRIRPVEVHDLLGREPVVLEEQAISEFVGGRVVLVTGAGGSIGAELCHQLCRFSPAKLLLLDQAEGALYQIHRALRREAPRQDVVACIGDVCDDERVEQLFRDHRPEVVFHAAAHKHVPLMEENPSEAVKNNVFGTCTVADAASRFGAAAFVQISTDKAVNPTSVMGATKRVAELYLQALSSRSDTRYVMVRFGNVLGSAGSVVPLFKEQIALGGPVTVTHPDMERYFMTIPEASQLVLQAASMGEGGEVFVLDMGAPVKIVDLAHDLIALSGFRPGGEIQIEFTGIRPGEKLFEELALCGERADRTGHPKIFVGRVEAHTWEEVSGGLEALQAAVQQGPAAVRAQLQAVVPEYAPQRAPSAPVAAPASRPRASAPAEGVA